MIDRRSINKEYDESNNKEDISISFSLDNSNIQSFDKEFSSFYSESIDESLYENNLEIDTLEQITKTLLDERSKLLYIPNPIKDLSSSFCNELFIQFNEKTARSKDYNQTVSTKFHTYSQKMMKTPTISSDNERERHLKENLAKRNISDIDSHSRNKTELKISNTEDNLLNDY